MAQNRLGELLVREKLISLQQLRKAQDEGEEETHFQRSFAGRRTF